MYIDGSGNAIVNKNKALLLNIAIDGFSLHGYSAVSIRDITRKAGIKESSFYNHFKSKEELLETIFLNFRRSTEKIMPPLEQVGAIVEVMDTQTFLRTGLRNFMDHVRAPKMEQIWRILYIEQCRNEAARRLYLEDVIGKTVEFLAHAFRAYADRGKIRPRDPKSLAVEYQYPLFTMVSEYILLRLDGRETADIERLMNEHVAFFASIIAPAEAQA